MAPEAAALAGIGFLGALVFGITGFGSALVTIPVATHLVPLEFALALFALMDLCSAYSVGFENPRNAVRAEWRRLVPMILAGTALGVTLLVNLPRVAGMLLLGLSVLSYALYSLARHSPARVIHAGWAAVRDLPVPARPFQGRVPRNDGLRRDDQHLAAHRGVSHHRPAPRPGGVAHRGCGHAGGACGSLRRQAAVPPHLARGADARGRADPARLRRLACGAGAALRAGRGSPGR